MSYDWALTGHANKQTKTNYYLYVEQEDPIYICFIKMDNS